MVVRSRNGYTRGMNRKLQSGPKRQSTDRLAMLAARDLLRAKMHVRRGCRSRGLCRSHAYCGDNPEVRTETAIYFEISADLQGGRIHRAGAALAERVALLGGVLELSPRQRRRVWPPNRR